MMMVADLVGTMGGGYLAGLRKFLPTVSMTFDFVAPARVGDWVEGAGTITGRDADIFTVTGRIWCGERTIMAATGIFKALGTRPPRRKA